MRASKVKPKLPSKVVVYVTKYIATYRQGGEESKEIGKRENIKETGTTFFKVLENPTTEKIIQAQDEIEERVEHGNTLEWGWREYNDFFNEFKHQRTMNMAVYVGDMSYREYSEAVLHRVDY